MNSRNINPNLKNSPKDLKNKRKEQEQYYKGPIDETVQMRSDELIRNLEKKVAPRKSKRIKKNKDGSILSTSYDLKKVLMVSSAVAVILIVLGVCFAFIFGHKNLAPSTYFEDNVGAFVWNNIGDDQSQGSIKNYSLKDYTKKSVSDDDIRMQSTIDFTFKQSTKKLDIYKVAFKIKVQGTGYLTLKLTFDNYEDGRPDQTYFYTKLFTKSGEEATFEIITAFRFNKLSGASEYEKQKMIIEVAGQDDPASNGSITEDTILGYALYGLNMKS